MKRLIFMCAFVLSLTTGVWAWHLGGHHALTLAAVSCLPEEIPSFFRGGAPTIAHMSLDPDMGKHKGTPHVRASEYPEHFLDREMLKAETLPESRYDYIRLCYEHEVAPEKIGLLPYALGEWTERLAVAFAEHRKWPDNPHIKMKCLVYAGFVAHYAEDMCQPLHLTVHYNGWVNEDGTIAQKGIHAKVDGLIEFFKMNPETLAKNQRIVPIENLMAGILAQFRDGFGRVGRVYELGERIPDNNASDWEKDPEVIDFAVDRARASVQLTAQLYLTAWQMSASLNFDDFVTRAEWDGLAPSPVGK
ncbi:MAG: hypothetical protein O3B73_16730 [bacterium]|jgi:hypothetical protein|nr:hypothetical protein [bacterium]